MEPHPLFLRGLSGRFHCIIPRFLRFIDRVGKDEARRKRLEREKAAREAREKGNLRSPIVCIMGHVDTGNLKLDTLITLERVERTVGICRMMS